MKTTNYFKLPDAEFLAFAYSIYSQCDDNETKWKLDSQRMVEFGSLRGNADSTYKLNSDLSERNHLTAVQKNKAFGELKSFLSLFINYLEGNESVPDDALESMHLRPRKYPARHPLPVPTEVPLIETTQQHDEITIYVTRIEHGQPAQGVQLKPYHGFKLKWKFEDEEDWHVELSTRLHYTIFFDVKDEARRIIATVAWVNPRLQEGPWCLPINLVIS
jgi:hypothetical protein